MPVSPNFIAMAAAVLATALTAPLGADPIVCPGGRFVTDGAGTDAPLICETAARASDQLASCNLTVPEPLTIRVLDTLEANCLGLYHCGEDLVDIMPPAAYAELQNGEYSGLFAPISEAAFFESILRHELAHAALDDMDCPFDSCIVGQEYIAYTMQIRFLPEADRAASAEINRQDEPVSRDALNSIILQMAPDVFARRAWQHLAERDDPCAYIGMISRGEILLDFEHF